MFAWYHIAISDLESRHECVRRAYLNSDDTRNGWACPHFEKSEVKRMVAWFPEFDDSLVFDKTTDAFTATYDPDAPESFTDIEIDGMHLYPIGNESWTWSIVEGNAPDSVSPEHC
ncbi:hypothetical protein [Collinsella bouchesdurhonensis]|uniref:hypothetical protein n=1 Tax=Collinsella bouchesdurhonensis TaxID=1907654 RepID=UPI000694C974|nr:hypothetical protein [Collinsella bouchesdurhonensis]